MFPGYEDVKWRKSHRLTGNNQIDHPGEKTIMQEIYEEFLAAGGNPLEPLVFRTPGLTMDIDYIDVTNEVEELKLLGDGRE